MTEEKKIDGTVPALQDKKLSGDAPVPATLSDEEVRAAKELASDDGKEEIFNFPCDFPIKVMGKTHADFAETIMTLVEQHDPTFERSRVETRTSGGGNYTGLTVHIMAHSRAQLDKLYLALTGHPMVKIVL